MTDAEKQRRNDMNIKYDMKIKEEYCWVKHEYFQWFKTFNEISSGAI